MKQDILRFLNLMLAQDRGKGDISSRSVIPASAYSKAVIIAKESGILAGISELRYFLSRHGLDCDFKKKDGGKVKKGDIVAEISGSVRDILKFERLALNVLGRMSGIATYTHEMARKLSSGVTLCATRKTLWGMLDKKAVVVGGGGAHRLGLYDAILLKDNHLAYYKGDVSAMLGALKKYLGKGVFGKFVEVEVDSLRDFKKVLFIFNKWKNFKGRLIIMLDNMPPAVIKKAVLLRNHMVPKRILLEASGGITEKNIRAYAKIGVDIISMGRLTMGGRYLDFSLELIPH